MTDPTGTLYLRDVIERFRAHKKMGERAIAQVYDSGLAWQMDPEANSIGIIVKHMAGNMRSRWTGFLTTDGEKPDRDRDGEFELEAGVTREKLLEWWDDGWARMLETLESLRPEDLGRTVMIRGQPHTALEAINVQLAHYAYHVGQIVQIARHLAGPAWKSLSLPKKKRV